MSSPKLLGVAPICAVLVFVACSPDGDFTRREAKLEASPTEVRFTNRPISTEATVTVLVKNVGDIAASLLSPELQGDTAVFSIDLSERRVAANGISELTVRFAPSETGQHEATIVLRAEDPSVGQLLIPVFGEAVQPCVVVEPAVIDFGSVRIGSPQVEDLTVRNECEEVAQVRITAAENAGACADGDSAPYCVALTGAQSDGTVNIDVGESRTFRVEFDPTVTNLRERGRLEVRYCEGAACVTDVRLDGIGIDRALQCGPESLDFGAVNPDSCRTLSARCENVANVSVTILGWRIDEASTPFESLAPAAVAVVPGERLDIDVRYCPPALGEHEATLVIDTDERPQIIRIPVLGSGGGPDISVSPSRLDFGQVSTLARARRSLLITNVGHDDLVVQDMIFDDPSGPFRVVDAPAAPIPAGGSVVVIIEAHLTAAGAATARLLVQSNDSDEPEVVVELSALGVVLGPCVYEVAPVDLNFGVVEVGRPLGRAVAIRNTGSTECLVTGVRVTLNDRDAYSVDATVASTFIAPGASTTIHHQFTPDAAGTYRGETEIGLSSPNEPFVTVSLVGEAVEGALLIAPNALDFGTVGVGCAARDRIVTVYNTSGAAVTIDSIGLSVEATNFTVRGLPALPHTLLAGEQFDFIVGFASDRASRYAGAVEIDIGSSLYLVTLAGEGAADAVQVDEFTQVPVPKADILFVIDNSCSMSEEQAAIAANFPAFIQFAVAQNLDYQIGVISTDVGDLGLLEPITGAPAHRIVTDTTAPTPDAVFAQNVSLGISGSGLERGFETARMALSAPANTGHNAGFIRQDAVLSVIFVSDEQDQSFDTVAFYANFFRSLKGAANRHLFTASAIVSPSPVCPTAFTAGTRYIELARQTGGVVQSICTASWQRALQDIATIAFGFRTRFELTSQPTAGTIDVTVDGVRIPSIGTGGTINWRYDGAQNAVNFTPFAAPEAGARIRIEYAVDCL